MDRLEALRPGLERVGQGHLLRFADELGEGEREVLAGEIEALDLAALPALVEELVLKEPAAEAPAGVEPASYYGLGDGSWDPRRFKRIGEDLLESGRVA
jgi:hypothetical protein